MKKFFDFSFVLLTAIIWVFPFLVILLVVRIFIGKPIIFFQTRPGLHGKPFILYKFRTMTDSLDKEGRSLSDGDRITPLGNFLRKTSLDELPELWNVLKGDMCLVGPRPLLMEYLDRYTPEQARRHEVKPGVTGWAQVNGRNAISWEEKFKLDVWYVDNWSLFLDFKILILTFFKVIKGVDVNQSGHITMEEFKGYYYGNK